MKKICCCLVMLAVYTCVMAQDEDEYKRPSEASLAYHEYRLTRTDPPYSLYKIRDLISKLKPADGSDDMGGTIALDQKIYLSLSLREKFTYHMIHPETYSQNCDAMPPIQDEEKKIFGQLPDVFGENSWSDKQNKFFLANRDSVIALMEDCATKQKHIGLHFKHVIVDINAREMIPFIIATYNVDKKDHDLLTVLMLLMKNNEYPEFLTSTSYKKLYANTDYETSYKAHLVFNIANEALIIKRATDFYNGLHK